MSQAEGLWGHQFYIAWQCVWLQDGQNPQYAFKGAFLTEEQAWNGLKVLQGNFNKLNQVNKVKLQKNPDAYPIYWNQTHKKFTDKGCFRVVSYEQIEKSLQNVLHKIIQIPAQIKKETEPQTQNTGIWGKKVYLAWKCVHLQDDINAQYEFKGAFNDQQSAKNLTKTFFGPLSKLSSVTSLVVDKNTSQENSGVFWNEKYQQFTDKGCYMCVSYEKIQKSLMKNSRKKVQTKKEPEKNQLKKDQPKSYFKRKH